MFDVPSVRIGRLFGIPLEVNFSWFIIFGLLAFTLSASVFPNLPASQGSPGWLFVLVGSMTALLFFGSIVLHELCHSLVARATGGEVHRITLFLFGGVAQMDEEPSSPGREFLMAAAGPAMSFLISGIAFIGYLFTAALGSPWWVWAPLEYLAGINLLVALFNLLPGFPLDGGRVLRSVLWGATRDLLTATRWASRVGQFIGWTMVVVAVLGVLRGSADLIWFGLIGWFIASLAGQAYRQQVVGTLTQAARVADVMTASPEVVPGEVTLDELVHDWLLGGRHTRYPVLYDGSIVGLITIDDVKSVPRESWPNVRAVDVAYRDLGSLVVERDAPVRSVLARLAEDRPGALIVSTDGRLAGIVTRADVMELLRGADATGTGGRG